MKFKQFMNEGLLFSYKTNATVNDNKDVVENLLPVIIQLAYRDLSNAKTAHEKKYGARSTDEDAYNFNFTEDALIEEIDFVIEDLTERLRGLSLNALQRAIKQVSNEFAEPLQKSD